MTSPQVEERIRLIISELLHLPRHKVTRSASLFDDLGADAIDIPELFASIDWILDIDDTPTEDFQKLATVADIVEYVLMKRKALAVGGDKQ